MKHTSYWILPLFHIYFLIFSSFSDLINDFKFISDILTMMGKKPTSLYCCVSNFRVQIFRHSIMNILLIDVIY